VEEEDYKIINHYDENDDENNDENESRGTILRFIAQIYSPVNNVNNDKVMSNDPFHRTLYIFACPHPLCSNNQSGKNDDNNDNCDVNNNNNNNNNKSLPIRGGSVIVLRSQLSRANQYYPVNQSASESMKELYDNDNEIETNKNKDTYYRNILQEKLSSSYLSIHLPNLCIVCGQRANIQCDSKQFWFCGKEHKKEYLDAIVDTGNATSNHYEDEQIYCPSVYAESELVVEEEPMEAEEDDEGDDKNMLSMEETRSKSLFPNDHKKKQQGR